MDTYISSFQVLREKTDLSSLDTDLAAASDYAPRGKAEEIDLLKSHGSGSETKANAVCLLLNGTGASSGASLTQVLYGRSDNGPYQKIAEIQWVIGTARADGSTPTFLWAGTVTILNSYHPTSIGAVNGPVASVWFDACGYRHLLSLFTAKSGTISGAKCLYRVY